MRETFHDLGDVLNYYQKIKLHVRSMPTILPKEEFGDKSRVLRSKQQQNIMENNYAFISDVENFIEWFYPRQKGYFKIPKECLFKIFQQKFYNKELSPFQSWGHLALHFTKCIKRGENLPARLRHKRHLLNIGHAMIEKCNEYFMEIGFIIIEDDKSAPKN